MLLLTVTFLPPSYYKIFDPWCIINHHFSTPLFGPENTQTRDLPSVQALRLQVKHGLTNHVTYWYCSSPSRNFRLMLGSQQIQALCWKLQGWQDLNSCQCQAQLGIQRMGMLEPDVDSSSHGEGCSVPLDTRFMTTRFLAIYPCSSTVMHGDDHFAWKGLSSRSSWIWDGLDGSAQTLWEFLRQDLVRNVQIFDNKMEYAPFGVALCEAFMPSSESFGSSRSKSRDAWKTCLEMTKLGWKCLAQKVSPCCCCWGILPPGPSCRLYQLISTANTLPKVVSSQGQPSYVTIAQE